MPITLKSKTAVTKSAKAAPAKPKAKATGTRKATPKPAAKKATAATGERRRSSTDMTQAQLKKVLGPLETHSRKRDEFNAKWKEEIREVNDRILDALNQEVPIHLIVKSANVSRQHVYKLIEDAKAGKRSNGSKPKAAPKTAAKPKTGTAKKTAPKRKITPKRK